MNLFKKTILRDVEKLHENEEREAFCIPPDHRQYRAIMGLLLDHIDDARLMVRDPRALNNPGALAGAVGAMDALETLYADIESKRKEANK